MVLSKTAARLLCELQLKERIAKLDEVIVSRVAPPELKRRAVQNKGDMVRLLQRFVAGAPLPKTWRDGRITFPR